MLWDKEDGRIVCNESAEIIRMFNSDFDEWAEHPELDFYPAELRGEIDSLNDWIYDDFNNAVYMAGFARSQGAYERAYHRVFDFLPRVEERLSSRRYLTGDRVTEADWRLFVTLVRFDAVYNLHFKCNGARIVDYPNLWGYTRDLYQWPGVAGTVAMDEIKTHYYRTHTSREPERHRPARAGEPGLHGTARAGIAAATLSGARARSSAG